MLKKFNIYVKRCALLHFISRLLVHFTFLHYTLVKQDSTVLANDKMFVFQSQLKHQECTHDVLARSTRPSFTNKRAPEREALFRLK